MPPAQSREPNVIRCALVHDLLLLRQGVRRLLEDEPDLRVVAEAGNAAEALRSIFECQPEVVILDSELFECDPAEAERLILQESPTTKVLFLSMRDADASTHPATSRASGSCRSSVAELVNMVRAIAGRQRGRNEAPLLFEELVPRRRALTTREREVLKLLAEGRTVRSVAEILGLSVKTVDAHKFNLMRKLGIHNKAELVMWAIQKQVVKVPVNL